MSEELKPEMTNDSVKLFLEYMIGVREFFNELEGDPKVILAKSLPALFEHLAEALELMPSDETLRAALAPVDVEGLKKDTSNMQELLAKCEDFTVGYNSGWNAAIDHLAARGFFGVWQPIETAPKDETVFVCRNKNKPHVTFEAAIFREQESWEIPTPYLVIQNMTIDEPLEDDWSDLEWMPLPAAPKKEG